MASKKLDPAKRVSAKTYNAALKVVNKLLKKFGKKTLTKLPAGNVGGTKSCPLYNAMTPLGIEEVADSNDLTAKLLWPGGTHYVDVDINELLTAAEESVLESFINEFDMTDLRVKAIISGPYADAADKGMAKARGLKSAH